MFAIRPFARKDWRQSLLSQCSRSLTFTRSSATSASASSNSTAASPSNPSSRPSPTPSKKASPPSAAAAAAAAASAAASSSSSYSSLKGTHDSLPPSVSRHRTIEHLFSQVASTYQYAEIRTPIIERADLFSRCLGAASDVVSKEMFSFDDHGTQTVLRPESTASVARAMLNLGISATPAVTRLYYAGPMFRRERPQAGRHRQFLQFGIELLGAPEAAADAEVIAMARECLSQAGVLPYVRLQLNSLGDSEARRKYVEALTAFLSKRAHLLSEDSRVRLERGSVLRILDSKDANDQALLRGTLATAPDNTPAPLLSEFLSKESTDKFLSLQQQLKDACVEYELNPFLVRGLDYYSHTCFEFVIDEIAVKKRLQQFQDKKKRNQQVPAQSSVLAGGRYDGLFETLGGPLVPAIGWAAGVERIILLQDLVLPARMPVPPQPTPIGVVLVDEVSKSPDAANSLSLNQAYTALCTYIRRGCPAPPSETTEQTAPSANTDKSTYVPLSAPLFSVVRSFNPSMSKQFKYCSRSFDFGLGTPAVQLTLIAGENEVHTNSVQIKQLATGKQETIPLHQLREKLLSLSGLTPPTTGASSSDLTYAQLHLQLKN